MMPKHKSTKLNGFKYCYLSLTIQLNISLFIHSSISNNSIYNKSFVCTQFKFQTVQDRTRR